jgi:hypothetical protein
MATAHANGIASAAIDEKSLVVVVGVVGKA